MGGLLALEWVNMSAFEAIQDEVEISEKELVQIKC